MTEKPSKEQPPRLSPDERGGESERCFPGHLLEEYLETLGDNKMLRLLEQGFKERERKLRKILANCKQEGECLIWQGPHSGDGRGGGYGRFSFDGNTCSVHRTVYGIVYGPIPPKKQIDHDCNNRLCCNPSHLVCMTHKKNQRLRDARKRGRP